MARTLITLPYPPSANRYWRVFRGHAVKSREARTYQENVATIAKRHGMKPVSGEVAVSIDVYRPAKRGDLDNTLKVAIDALKGFAYDDDKQVVELKARRFDDKKNPRIEVAVTETKESAV